MIGAIMDRLKSEVAHYGRCTAAVEEYAEHLQNARDEASAARERAAQCHDWLDEHIPGWLQAIDESERHKYTFTKAL